MALKKGTAAASTANAAAAQAAQFEGMGEDTGATAGSETTAQAETASTQTPAATDPASTGTTADLTPASADDAAAAVSEAAQPSAQATAQATTTALAQVKQHAMTLGGNKKFAAALSNLENVFDPAQLDFNTFPRVVVGLDGFSYADNQEDLGKEIGLEVLSFNTRYTLSPGVDSEEAKQHVRFSLDGKTVDAPTNPAEHGMAVTAYLDYLRNTLDYKDAAMKEYVAIYGFLTFKNGVVVDATEREIVGVQVPPQSRALFDRYKINVGLMQSRGLAPKHAGIRCVQEKIASNGRKYAQIKFGAEKDQSIIDTFFKEDEAAAA